MPKHYTLVAHAVFVRDCCPQFFFTNQLVEGLGTIFGWLHFSHTRTFWPKGKKYILKNIKKNCAFYDFFFDFLGHFRGGFNLTFFI